MSVRSRNAVRTGLALRSGHPTESHGTVDRAWYASRTWAASSEFDAPIDVVWRFLGTPEVHAPAHEGTRGRRVTPLAGSAIELSMEQRFEDAWFPVRNRITMLPPVAMAIEALEGPLAGSRSVYLYSPKGPKTGVDVYGEFVSPQFPEDRIEGVVRGFLDRVFREDSTALRTSAASRP